MLKDYKQKDNIELKQLAMDIYDQKVFTNRHIRPEEQGVMVGIVFMPIALGAFKDWEKEDLEQIGIIYEYYDKAGPRGINGMPMFTSFSYISVDDTMKMEAFYQEYKTFKDSYASSPKLPNQV